MLVQRFASFFTCTDAVCFFNRKDKYFSITYTTCCASFDDGIKGGLYKIITDDN